MSECFGNYADLIEQVPRIRDFVSVGPVQRAAVDDLMDLLVDSIVEFINENYTLTKKQKNE